MAVAVTQVGRRTVFGDRRAGVYDIVFSGNYATGGEAVTAGLFGMNFIDAILAEPALATDGGTAVVTAYRGTSASGGTIFSYESAATGLPLLEKTNAEAYITGQTARVLVIGA